MVITIGIITGNEEGMVHSIKGVSCETWHAWCVYPESGNNLHGKVQFQIATVGFE